MTTELRVEGMNCENCVRHVREALERIDGVARVDLDLATSQAVVEHEDNVGAEKLVLAIEDEGYTATSVA